MLTEMVRIYNHYYYFFYNY